MGAGVGVLLVDLHGIHDADFLEGVVPFENPIANPPSVPDRDGVLDVEHDGLLRRAHLEARIGLLEMPPIDVTLPRRIGRGITKILDAGGEVTDPVVRLAGSVSGVAGNRRDGVVELRESTAAERHLIAELDVLREGLGLLDGHEPGVRATGHTTEEAGRLIDEEAVQIDDRSTTRTHRENRDFEDDAVREDSLRRILTLLVTGRDDREVGLDQRESLAESLPLRILIAGLNGRSLNTGRDGPGEEEVLLLEVPRQLRKRLLGLLVDPESIETALCRPPERLR